MTEESNARKNNQSITSNEEYQGIYGNYVITDTDKKEVKFYRISVLITGIAFLYGMLEWLFAGPKNVWISLIIMATSLGLSLHWIHIYLRPIHQSLRLLWAIGFLGTIFLILNFGSSHFLTEIVINPKWTILIGPLFASLAGLGFKEFFCFRQFEAIGLTLLVPIALLGHLSQILKLEQTFSLLIISAILLVIMAIRKFGINASADIGDKSIFDFLETQNNFDKLNQ